MIQIAILDNHSLFRLGVQCAFNGASELQVSGEAQYGMELFRILSRKLVNVVLIGVNRPDDRQCVYTVCRLRKKYPEIKILALADENAAEMIPSLTAAGVNGYIGKRQANRNELLKAVRKIAEGGEYVGRISG